MTTSEPTPALPSWLTRQGITPTAEAVPDFELARFDAGLTVYQEALIDSRYLGAELSAMGRPKPRWWVWGDLRDGAAVDRPLRSRQHAFQLQIDGQDLIDGWTMRGARDSDGLHILSLRHDQRGIDVDVCTRLDQTRFITRHLVITNAGASPCAVAAVSPWAGMVWEVGVRPWDDVELTALPTGPFSLGRMTDSSAGTEGSFDWAPLPAGRSGFESMHGRSGWGVPFCVLRNDATGELFVMDFGWSGNWSIEFFNDFEPARRPVCDARVYVQAKLAGPAPLRVLEPGESASTPAVHLTTMFGSLDEAAQELHRHVRSSVTPPQPAGREHRVEVNHTAFTRNHQVTEAQLYEEIDLAADVGAELFMLDAGWFGEESSLWSRAVGDWGKESPLLTRGVRAALDHARDRGMLAGLWVEPERVGPDSDVAREHPDWLMTRLGERILNFDLSRPEVARHVEDTIVGIIDRYELDCFRIDYNHNIGEGGVVERGGRPENVMWRYYDALYGIFDRIRARYPDLLLENCSSGGGRVDLGIMSRFHWTQITDRWSPGPTTRIFNGASLRLPPELCESVIGGISQGVSDLDFLIRANMFGHFKVSGLFPTRAERNTDAFERWRHGVALYKQFCRPLLSTSTLYHHTPIQRQTEPGTWIVLESASVDRDRGYVGVFRLPGATDDDYLLRPRGIDPARRYRIRFDSAGTERTVDGGTLVDSGIRVPVGSALRSELLLLDAL